MELRRRSTIHFIQTIKSGTVLKMSNLESEKKPSFVFKELKDIYKASEPGDLGVSSKLKWKDTFMELALDGGVKTENPCVSSVDRNTREIDYSDDEDLAELNFASTTLKQIKEKCKTKKRKQGSDCFGLSPKQECTKLELEEDEYDLMESLCVLKSRIAKIPKIKRKCIEKRLSPSSIILEPVIAEPITDDNDFVQCEGNLLTVSVKVEDPLSKHSKNHIAEFGAVNSSKCLQQERSGEVLEERKWDTQTVKSSSITEQCGVVNIQSHEDLETTHDNNVEAVKNFNCEAQNVKPISMAEKYRICFLSSVSYEHLLHVHDDTADIESQGKTDQDSTNVSEIKEEYVKHSSLNNDSEVISSSKYLSNFDVQVSSGDNNDCGSHFSGEPTKDFPSSNLIPSLGCESSVVSEVELQSPALKTTGRADICSYSESKIFVDGDTKSQPVHLNEEKNSSIYDDTISDLLTSEEWHLPERLPSTRKAIAPTSEERVRLSMTSVEADTETVSTKYKSGENNGVSSDLTDSPKNKQVVLTKSTKPKDILKKWKKFRKGSPPKGSLEGSHTSLRFSSGCTSIQACSESAIAFSQRQMQDIEHLAVTLMAELKSVKEIVEEKLLCEAYRNPAVKNDADEIKSVIKNASRAEVTSKRWLSLMARDCNRFCKIMKMKDNETSTPSTTSAESPIKKQKKIMFADEAGGTLCQVKLFEDYVEIQSEIRESQAE